MRSEPNVGVPVTSGKPADAGRLGTSIPRLEPASAFLHGVLGKLVARRTPRALNIYFLDNKFEALHTVKSSRTLRE